MHLAAPSNAHLTRFLALEYQASKPYTDFAYASEAQAEDARRLLYEKGAAEYAPPHGKLLFADVSDATTESNAADSETPEGTPAGMIACLTGADLRRQRMKSALALSKAGLFEEDPALQARLKKAGQVLLHPEDDDFYLSRIAVREGARGRGLGSFLMDHFEEEAHARGCQRLVLEVAPSSEAAVALYRARGFEAPAPPRRVTDEATGRTLTYLHMTRSL